MLANTSMKCVGGVSAKDARSLADELHTTPTFIEGMKRRGTRSEFAVWVKHLTGQAIRISVPLGFLEGQCALDEDEYRQLIDGNRTRFCGTLADIPTWEPARAPPDIPSSPIEPVSPEAVSSTTERQAPFPPPVSAADRREPHPESPGTAIKRRVSPSRPPL